MPSSMTHLLCAKLLAPEKSTAFFVGNISPDCIDVREFKDHTHFRDLPEESRLDALRALALSYDWRNDEYLFGIIFHLFADYTWDTGPQRLHRELYRGDDWFHDYRREINEAGRSIYARYTWSSALWDDMARLDPSFYSGAPEYPPAEIKRFILHGKERAAVPCSSPSDIFTPDAVDSYASDTAARFTEFMKSI